MASPVFETIHQASAVPFRRAGGRVEFCLVTSASSGQWVFPKGLIDPGETADFVVTLSNFGSGQALNIAGGARISLNQVIVALNELLGKQIAPRYEAPRPGDIRHSQADITLAGRLIGFAPSVSFDTGLARTVDWYKSRTE